MNGKIELISTLKDMSEVAIQHGWLHPACELWIYQEFEANKKKKKN